MSAAGHGSAMRRRKPQLRAWRRHVKMTVAMRLATALHHSAQPAGPVVVGSSEGEVRETYDALRRLKAPLPGKRKGQGAAVTGGYVAAGAPLLRRRQRRRHRRLLPPGRERQADEERGGGEGEEAEVEGGEVRDAYAGTGSP